MIILDIPFAFTLSSNQRLHHMARAKRSAFIRNRAAALWKALDAPSSERVDLRCQIQFRDRRRRDASNYQPSIKGGF